MPKTPASAPIAMAWLTRLPAQSQHASPARDAKPPAVTSASRGAPSHELAPPKKSLRTPSEPLSSRQNTGESRLPTIDEEDRSILDSEALVRAAIVLDVLATKTSDLETSPSVLDALSGHLVDVARACKLPDESTEELLESLRGATGAHRELLSRAIRASQFAHGERSEVEPDDVVRAMKHIANLTRIAIREASLVLDPGPLVDYRKV